MGNIYLIGFMGSGKSTIGKAYAEKYSKVYVDTDDFIEAFHGKKITEIFKHNGEETFREFETEALKKVSTYEVISTGGGIVENINNLHTMQKDGVIIYLDTNFSEIVHRLENDQTRPLWNDHTEDKLNLFNRRIPLYEKFADYIIDTNEKTIDEITEEIRKVIEV